MQARQAILSWRLPLNEMINNNENKNVQLTLEQMRQIEETEKRLSSLEGQISAANKNLRVLTTDCTRYEREREALKTSLASVSEELKKKNVELASVKKEHSKVSGKSEALNKEIKEKTGGYLKKEAYISERESKINISCEKRPNV